MEFEFVLQVFTYLFAIYCSIYYYFNLSNKYEKKLGRYKWDCFTRIMSTINAVQCTCMSLYVLNNNVGIWNILQGGEDLETYSLLSFATYLFVDGLLQLPDLITQFSPSLVLSVLHHFVGGYGIYLIGSRRIGLFLGIYFAITEISTPFLNLSWWFYRNKIQNVESKSVFITFYILFVVFRIFTIPLLGLYLFINFSTINNLKLVEYVMVYYGSLILVLLNSIWFIMLSIKIKQKLV